MHTKKNPIFTLLAQAWPEAKCELEHNSPFQLLIAVVLSAQSTDKSVNKALKPIFTQNPEFNAADLLQMGEKNFFTAIRSIGLAPTKAKNCLKTAAILQEKYAGKVPLTAEQLEALPGVGRKSSNVLLNILAKLPTMAVDTHVERVSKRLGLVPQNASRLKVEEILLKIVPKKYSLQAHHFLVFQGRYQCTAKKPKCESCCLQELCPKLIESK